MTVAQLTASAIFIVTFVVILSERLHRTIAALAGATSLLARRMSLRWRSWTRRRGCAMGWRCAKS